MAKENLHSFVENLERLLADLPKGSATDASDKGVIESYKDGVIAIKGLSNLMMSEVVVIEGADAQALVMNVERGIAYALVLQASPKVKEGLFVKQTGQFLSIPVGDGVLGRVVDPTGQPLDGMKAYKAEKQQPLEAQAPDVMARKSVHQPVQTGIAGIDSLIPIGRGQRELIIGDRQTGKTTVALDTIINQKNEDMICVYVSVGQREGKTAQVINTLKEHGAMDYTVVVSAPAASSAVLQYLAPYAGVAIAEYFMYQGKDVVIVYDDLSKHAVAYREMSLLLRRPPGREAYPGDVFYLHSRLLERAAKLNDELGGGSITALPIIETQANDVSAYIPTNVISITDGQIFLQSDLFNKGIRPAINVGISVSRVGGSAQTNVMKKVSGSVKLDLAQYYELEAFSQFASELDEATKAKLTRGKRVVEALKQKQNSPYALWQMVFVLYAASNGFLDATDVDKCPEAISTFLAHIEANHADVVKDIQENKKMTDEVKASLKSISESYFK